MGVWEAAAAAIRQQRRTARGHGPGAVERTRRLSPADARGRFESEGLNAALLPDVNVLVYAYREDMADRHRYRDWLGRTVNAVRTAYRSLCATRRPARPSR